MIYDRQHRARDTDPSAVRIDSLGHYAAAPMALHTWAMNATILLEVAAAAAVLVEVSRRFVAWRSARARRGGGT